jgi:hypothetical protein
MKALAAFFSRDPRLRRGSAIIARAAPALAAARQCVRWTGGACLPGTANMRGGGSQTVVPPEITGLSEPPHLD